MCSPSRNAIRKQQNYRHYIISWNYSIISINHIYLLILHYEHLGTVFFSQCYQINSAFVGDFNHRIIQICCTSEYLQQQDSVQGINAKHLLRVAYARSYLCFPSRIAIVCMGAIGTAYPKRPLLFFRKACLYEHRKSDSPNNLHKRIGF